MGEFTYKTIAGNEEGLYKEKGSKFIALAYPVHNEEDVKRHIAEVKRAYHDARHHCYAYALGPEREQYRLNDDGEPSGTAGRPIHGQLLSKDVTDTLIIVVRYFGGIKLGVSGLLNAYKTAAKDALEHADIVERQVEEAHQVSFPALGMNKVMQVLKRDTVRITGQQYDEVCTILFSVQKRDAGNVLEALRRVEGAKL